MLSDSEFLRYSRQLLLEEIGEQGQSRLKHSTALIVGLGGLGSPVSLYLAAAGVGTLILADDDNLHLTNLQRQILFDTNDIQQPKAELAARRLRGLNPTIRYRLETQKITQDTLPELLDHADLVIDCCDNMATRHAVNAACISRSIPLISGSAVGFSGQLFALTPPFDQGCYACLYPDKEEPARNCRTAGVLGPMVGIIGSLQALEAVKILAGQSSPLSGQLRLFNGKQHTWTSLKLRRDPFCSVCGGLHANHTE